MLRRSAVLAMSKQRTVIRDPRKTKKLRDANKSTIVASINQENHQPEVHQSSSNNPLPFNIQQQQTQSLGLGSYMLAGVGVAMGVTLVSAIFGAIIG